jgi:hypothetical protein
MPYVDETYSVCRPGTYYSVNEGDIIVTLPSIVKSKGISITMPPLSIINHKCETKIDTLSWIDGIEVSNKHKVNLHAEDQVNILLANIIVESPNIHSAYTLKWLLDGKMVNVSRKETKNKKLVSILRNDENVLVGIDKERKSVELFVDNVLFKAFAYSLFYYVPLVII